MKWVPSFLLSGRWPRKESPRILATRHTVTDITSLLTHWQEGGRSSLLPIVTMHYFHMVLRKINCHIDARIKHIKPSLSHDSEMVLCFDRNIMQMNCISIWLFLEDIFLLLCLSNALLSHALMLIWKFDALWCILPHHNIWLNKRSVSPSPSDMNCSCSLPVTHHILSLSLTLSFSLPQMLSLSLSLLLHF